MTNGRSWNLTLRRSRRFRPEVETLEVRALPTVTTSLRHGVLLIQGDEKDNNVTVRQDVLSGVVVVGNGYGQDRWPRPRYFPGTLVKQIRFFGEGGNDTLDASGLYRLGVWADGGDGHDFLTGGFGDDTLLGGAGNDDLYGNFGNDRLFGQADSDFLLAGSGDDLLVGGRGRDYLNGQAGNDVLVADGKDPMVIGGNAYYQRLVGQVDTYVGIWPPGPRGSEWTVPPSRFFR